jgi:hypothetical protein
MDGRLLAGVIAALLSMGNSALAQTARPGGTPAPTGGPTTPPNVAAKIQEAATPPKRPGQLVNVRIEFTITEQRAGAPPNKRTVTVMVADGEAGSVRSEPEAFQVQGVQLNVDARPTLVSPNKMRLNFSMQYAGPTQGNVSSETPRGTVLRTNLRESISVIVDDDKPLLVAQSADPTSDRTVTVEVKATILR